MTKNVIIGLCSGLALAGCQKEMHAQLDSGASNLVTSFEQNPSKKITFTHENGKSGDAQVLGHQELKIRLANHDLLSPNSEEGKKALKSLAGKTAEIETSATDQLIAHTSQLVEAKTDNSLVLGMPIGLIGQQNVFGGVITEVSNKTDENLGGLKLSDITPLHVKTVIADAGTDHASLALLGCDQKCTETSPQQVLIKFPVLAIDEKAQQVVVDLAALAGELNFEKSIDPDHSNTGLKARRAITTKFDYSFSTLVFDVETHMIDKNADPKDAKAVETVFTMRWYLKLTSGFNPSFVSRPATPGVGFFVTDRGAETKITRFGFSDFGTAAVKYYLKNVPKQWQSAFSIALEDWNQKLLPVIGRKIFDYEFVSSDDAKGAALIPGDIRYNIIEWDLNNRASYGGLGPSIANQFTGETFTANVLIQGPAIMEIYTKWFQVAQTVQKLKALGKNIEADALVLSFERQLAAEENLRNTVKFKISLGEHLPFRIPAQEPPFQDPRMQRPDFDAIPEGYTFQNYMNGYFHDMLSHEVGHNLGLRHNFRGNLGAGDMPFPGKVSRSIMEYLDRNFRHLDEVGEYDLMAIAYGYTGKKPAHLNWYCTDEDSVSATNPTHSAECSSNDATNDPFSFYEGRLAKALSLAVAKDQKTAPTWTPEDMARELKVSVEGISSYASSALETASGWTNFFGKADRPSNAALVPAYVVSRLKGQLCDPSLKDALNTKESEETRNKTLTNLEAFRAKILELTKPFFALKVEELKCSAN